jgi:hypothetical protein
LLTILSQAQHTHDNDGQELQFRVSRLSLRNSKPGRFAAKCRQRSGMHFLRREHPAAAPDFRE